MKDDTHYASESHLAHTRVGSFIVATTLLLTNKPGKGQEKAFGASRKVCT